MKRFAWRLFLRELRSGELRLLFVALALAVAAVTAVGFFADRVHQSLERESVQLLGADLLLVADHPWPNAIREEADRRGLQRADTLSFPSMVMGTQPQLAEIKGVSAGYPLRGRLRIQNAGETTDRPVDGGPAPGTVWIEGRLATGLQVNPGDQVQVGQRQFVVAAILTQELDRGANFFSFAPRLMMHLGDVPSTALIQVGSRLTYRLLVAGEPGDVAGFRSWVEARLGRGERIEDTRNARPEIRTALDRAERFLGFATLLTVVLAAVAVALAARRYMQRHLDACAILRCLGLTQAGLLWLHAGLFIYLALAAALVGCLGGFLAHFGLTALLGQLVGLPLPAPGGQPLLQGALVAGVLLLGFAFPPLLRLSQVPTLRVFRRELGAVGGRPVSAYLIGLVGLCGLIVWVAGDLRLGALASGGFLLAAALFWGIGRGAVGVIGRWRGGVGFGWRQGMANLSRHAASSSLQIAALAVGLMAMLLLTVTRGELLSVWRQSTPADAPNHFIINIQPEQVATVARIFGEAGVPAELSPMIRGRLQRIGGRPVDAQSYPDDDRAQRLIEREFNLSWRADLPDGNRLTAGSWFPSGRAGEGLASVEEGLAKTLGIGVGDELVFVVAGETLRMTVSNLRKLDWGSMRVNFFVLASPGILENAPASYITSVFLPDDKRDVARQLVQALPNLTVVDIGTLLTQVRTIMEQLARAIQFVFLFTVVSGLVVLYAALTSALDERRHELAVMRALGARKAQLRSAALVELTLVGGLAGLIAALGASIAGSVLARQVFQFDLPINWWLLPLAAGAGVLLSVSVGWFGIARLLATPPLGALRAGN